MNLTKLIKKHFIYAISGTALLLISCSENATNPTIAHRGAWKKQQVPENSIASLKHAINLGCYGSEFDVHLTKDSIMVVNHDKDFQGLDIETSTYKELLSKSLSNGEKTPTLKAYLEEGLKQHKTKLILEIKTAPSGKQRTLTLTKMAVDMVHELNGSEMVEYICFDYDAGKLVHQLDANAPVAYLKGDIAPNKAKLDGYTGIDYNINVFREHPEWVKEAHDEKMTVNVWTVNNAEDMKDMLKLEADFITTDAPEKLMEITQ
ncbi:glycerophosphodiester phosphodiesterase [Galbibacter pacificus]|uniref:Glycerophosphodiester phosphodiesterase family protein n=1 Tax=Galbibacter pacificus TaxID=2996052 RepID=A0ABT6FMW2_9FLAO|nr:glycerophosphodiester phosphodiesterase family protein [Galbibacter pacificus]MDG3581118.1 glycerophosphodiester phosphodiesterase family protein [Galbibacter pacificus]MDG3584596.1 glycerophosphodiester phosphodiesterase family protein [Galbibacter pacificus]